ncbi:hypothetical protein BI364_13695 [Acidihalobacter yilgarnensis]|uniref:HicB-like antitoxin of toxin-antitoxin system domain-containing protein n=1 Tax=Acidihalobacter yilgarnensis TaxID=2819280 RepID=A0A1D8IQV7_9GAMM|nr:type II toxin-antitoxin system HicB family antitoxin [Acidihalobacter yilgarnensis]AOU98871.1 hypothetical protein BI364_13695 [Acidihalobacter yilgarnensis]
MALEVQVMLFPLYVHKDAESAYSASFPDFPGCFTAADELNDLPRLAQEAVELYFEGEDILIPPPSDPEDMGQDDRYRDGYWMLVEIDPSHLRPARSVRLNISLPETLLHSIDATAKARHLSRSAFLAFAAAKELTPSPNSRSRNEGASMTTSKKDASLAGKALKRSKTAKAQKSVAGSDLAQAKRKSDPPVKKPPTRAKSKAR